MVVRASATALSEERSAATMGKPRPSTALRSMPTIRNSSCSAATIDRPRLPEAPVMMTIGLAVLMPAPWGERKGVLLHGKHEAMLGRAYGACHELACV